MYCADNQATRALVELGADLEGRDDRGCTALQAAAMAGASAGLLPDWGALFASVVMLGRAFCSVRSTHNVPVVVLVARELRVEVEGVRVQGLGFTHRHRSHQGKHVRYDVCRELLVGWAMCASSSNP